MGSKYIGTALHRPLKFEGNDVVFTSGLEVIKQSILDILFTPIGTRFFLREYGSRLEEVLFEQNDDIAKTLIRQFVKEALDLWEKRVKFEDISFELVEAKMNCSVDVMVVATNRIETFVFPFYRSLKY